MKPRISVSISLLVLCVSRAAIAFTLSGRVVDVHDVPVGGVGIGVIDAATGQPVATGGNPTNAQGVYAVSLPPGTFDVKFLAPAAERLADAVVRDVAVAANRDLGDTILEPGFLVSAQAVDPLGYGVAGVRIDDADLYSGVSAPTHDDVTDANGDVQFVMPAGTWDFVFTPPVATRLAGRAVLSRTLSADTSLGTVQLRPGFVLSGHVTSTVGSDVAGVVVRVIDESTGAFVPAAGVRTGAAGRWAAVVPEGSLTVTLEPPVGAGLAHGRVDHVAISGDTTVDVALDATPVEFGIARSGRLAPAGSSYAYDVVVRNATAAHQTVIARVVVADPLRPGRATVLGPRTKRLPPGFGPVSQKLALHIPASVPPRFRGRPLDLVVIGQDAASGKLLDEDLATFVVP